MRKIFGVIVWLGLSLGLHRPALCQAAASGQNAAAPQETGYAIGHVVCVDTQRPARVAQVRFVPVPAAVKAVTEQDGPKNKMADLPRYQLLGSEVNPVETDMEGNFVARNLKPGRYVVRVDLGGYLVPLLNFPPSDFAHPDEAARQRMERELQFIEIQPRSETRVYVSLQRGATLSGTVRFDDGSPAIGVATELWVMNGKGDWESTLSGYRFGATDAQGRYEVEGMLAGNYLVQVNLSLNEHSNQVMPMNGSEMHVEMTTTIFSLPVYSGNVLRKREATPIKVEGAGNYDGNDITLPISKLHRVSGAVVAKDGHALNGGTVVLRYPDDNSEVAIIKVNREDRQFHFPYVPEGSYTLAVEEARDVTETEVPNAPGVTPKTRIEEKTVRSYGKLEQPLVVQSDVEGVLATVPEARKTDTSATAQASE